MSQREDEAEQRMDEAQRERDAALAQVAALRERLSRMQWAQSDKRDRYRYCPACGFREETGHRNDCLLAALLTDTRATAEAFVREKRIEGAMVAGPMTTRQNIKALRRTHAEYNVDDAYPPSAGEAS